MAKSKKSKPKGQQPRPKGQQPKPKPKPAEAPADQAKPRKPTREERWEEARRAKRRRDLIIRAVAIGVGVAVVGGIAAWQITKRRNENRAVAAMEAGTCEFDRKSDRGAVNEHAPNVTFSLEPPSGGVHTPAVADPGVYIGRQAPPDGQIVHALEHGDIAVWYRPDLPEQDVQAIQGIAEKYETDVLVIPRQQLPVPFAATAWHKRLLCQRYEQAPLERFIRRYSDKGPEGQVD